MGIQRIGMADLVLGEPLRWDVLDEEGSLLLRKGYVIETRPQLDEILQRSLFIDAQHVLLRAHKALPAASKVKELPSVVHFVNLAGKRLEHLLFGLHLQEDAQSKLLEVAKTISFAVSQNPDIALACIMLNKAQENFAIRHSIDTAILSLLVAQALKKPPEEILSITAAALTMNLGMLRQQNLSESNTAQLSENELELLRKHPEESVNLLKQAGVTDQQWLTCVLYHHENENGSGYPFGKSGSEVPQNAKIISLSDIYCSRVTEREHRKPLLPNAALRGLFVEGCKTVDTQLARYFIGELGLYPPGSSVLLQSGEVGVVTRKGETPTTPVVHVHTGPRGVPLSSPLQRDTTKPNYAIQSALQSDDVLLRFSMQQLWGAQAAA